MARACLFVRGKIELRACIWLSKKTRHTTGCHPFCLGCGRRLCKRRGCKSSSLVWLICRGVVYAQLFCAGFVLKRQTGIAQRAIPTARNQRCVFLN